MTHEELEQMVISISSRVSYLEGNMRAVLEEIKQINIKLEEISTNHWELRGMAQKLQDTGHFNSTLTIANQQLQRKVEKLQVVEQQNAKKMEKMNNDN
jgi:regulator of replication initiation timing